MTKAGAGSWKTPLGYYERAIAELTKTREKFQTELQIIRELQAYDATVKADLQTIQTELQTIKTQLQATQAELQATKAELQATKAEFKIELQDKETELQTLKENFYQSLKSIFVKAPQWENATSNANWQTVITYELNLSSPTCVSIFGYGHGYASNESPLDIAIFINGEKMDEYWGVGLTHSHYWQPLLTVAWINLNSGNHSIKLKFWSRRGNGTHWVKFNGACMLITTTPNVN